MEWPIPQLLLRWSTALILDAVPSGKFLGIEMWLSLSKENNCGTGRNWTQPIAS